MKAFAIVGVDLELLEIEPGVAGRPEQLPAGKVEERTHRGSHRALGAEDSCRAPHHRSRLRTAAALRIALCAFSMAARTCAGACESAVVGG
jgi:hypothetical protein